MALFPKIQSPCPYKDSLASIMDGDQCRMCKRQVFDLTEMSDDQRLAFMAGCAGEVCVSYRLPVRATLAVALAVAASAAPMAAAAQQAPEVITEVVVGGIKDLGKVRYVQHAEDGAVSDLPVVYETPRAAPAPKGEVAPHAAPVTLRAPLGDAPPARPTSRPVS
jgi:hypothetical protein